MMSLNLGETQEAADRLADEFSEVCGTLSCCSVARMLQTKVTALVDLVVISK
jgi:hypothetical protein